MIKQFSSLACGVLFGLGLALSQMSNPAKITGFLDVSGNWDPSLLFVLGGAVAVTLVAFRFVRRLPRPVCGGSFEKDPVIPIDGRLIGGASLFGIGWGLSGYCPGPGFVSISRFAPDALVFVAAFLAGSWLYRLLLRPTSAA